jgi:CRP/FNR family transcriptional activator FtrB
MRPGTEALRALRLFADCTPAVLARLNHIADLVRLGPDEIFIRQGDRLDELNILIFGTVLATCSQPGGNESAADVIEPVRAIGMQAALLGVASPIGARTVTPARIIVIPAPALRTLMQKSPTLGSSFLDCALNDLQDLTQENCRLKLLTAGQRLAHYLLSLIEDPDVSPARFVLPFEKRLLAKLGCSQVNMSRAFTALRSVGVSTLTGVVVIRDVSQLRAYTGTSTA